MKVYSGMSLSFNKSTHQIMLDDQHQFIVFYICKQRVLNISLDLEYKSFNGLIKYFL